MHFDQLAAQRNFVLQYISKLSHTLTKTLWALNMSAVVLYEIAFLLEIITQMYFTSGSYPSAWLSVLLK